MYEILLRVKIDSVETIFRNCPSYLKKETPKCRSGAATSDKRLQNTVLRVRQQNKIMDEFDGPNPSTITLMIFVIKS